MARKQKIPTLEDIKTQFDKAYSFNQQIGLYDTVKVNEDFFIGNQWEGVESNNLPTPTFNFLKQVVLFQVSTITSDNMALQATPLASTVPYTKAQLETITDIITQQFAAILEQNRIVTKTREFLRNAAVDGDGCMHFYFDPTIENGQMVKGEIQAEIIENTRVLFGNPNCRDVQRQPFIIIQRREMVEDVRYRAEALRDEGLNEINDPDIITADSEKFQNAYDSYTDDKVTVLTYYFRNRDTNTIWCIEETENAIIREAYDTEYTMYPLVWLSWDYIHDCYHGQSMITGLLPNQKFVNKAFAMVMLSLMTTAFPKIVYDRNRVSGGWDSRVGTAIGVNGNVSDIAKTIDGASVNPQISQFIEMSVSMTRSFLGASDVARGDSRPDNTSAIIALQRAANTPMEMTKQNLYACIEEMGRIWLDIMAVRYGERKVEVKLSMDKPGEQPLGMQLPEQTFMQDFDFSTIRQVRMGIKQDVGASSYWSEMASMQTMDNLLINKLITPEQYVERLPSGYITKREELLSELRSARMGDMGGQDTGTGMSRETTSGDLPVPTTGGNGALQRALNREGV